MSLPAVAESCSSIVQDREVVVRAGAPAGRAELVRRVGTRLDPGLDSAGQDVVVPKDLALGEACEEAAAAGDPPILRGGVAAVVEVAFELDVLDPLGLDPLGVEPPPVRIAHAPG